MKSRKPPLDFNQAIIRAQNSQEKDFRAARTNRGAQKKSHQPPSKHYASTPKQRYQKHLERMRAEKRREYKGALGLTVFLVTIIFLSILSTDKIDYKLTGAVSDSWFSGKK